MKLRLFLVVLAVIGILSVTFYYVHSVENNAQALPGKVANIHPSPKPAVVPPVTPAAVALPVAATTRAIMPPTVPEPPPATPVVQVASQSGAGLSYAPEPTNGSTVALAAVKRLLTSNNPQKPVVVDAEAVYADSPLPVYALPIAAIEAGQGLENAQSLTEYLYLAESSNGPFAMIYVSAVSDTNARAKRSSFSPDGQPENALKSALQNVANDTRVRSGTYEPRILQLSASPAAGAAFSAIWLKSTDGKGDLIYPYIANNPSYNNLNVPPNTLMTADEFLSSVRTYYLNRRPPGGARGG